MEGWWMGLTGRIDEGLLEIIRTIDEEQNNEKTDSEGTTDREDQKPDKRELDSNYLFVINYCMHKLCTKVIGNK